LGTECEKEIYEAVIDLEEMGRGLSRKDILQLRAEIDSKKDTKFTKNALPSTRWYKRLTNIGSSPEALWRQEKKPRKNCLLN
jgi:hypothetical protein